MYKTAEKISQKISPYCMIPFLIYNDAIRQYVISLCITASKKIGALYSILNFYLNGSHCIESHEIVRCVFENNGM